jgi:hypothetical protein
MQADSSAASVATEQWEAEIGGLEQTTAGEAALPVPLPDAGVETSEKAPDLARAEEVRGLLAAIRRLQGIVEEETISLETGTKIDFDDFSTRKSRSMLEFVRLMRARIHLGGEAEIAEEIHALRDKLERNRTVLEMHYDAVREVAEIIVRAIKEAESDGTYSAATAQDGQ